MQGIRLRASGISAVRIIKWAWIPLIIGVLSACHLDMYDQPRYEPYGQSDFFADGAAARPLEPGTIPFNREVENTILLTGMDENGEFVQENPLQITDDVIATGKTQFGIYCAPCHGNLADGKGVAANYFQQKPPSMYLERLRTSPDGYIFDVITNGKGLMFPYNTQVHDVNNRWAIIAYIRDLQSQEPPEGVEANPTEQPTFDPNATPTTTAQPNGTTTTEAAPQAGTPTTTP